MVKHLSNTDVMEIGLQLAMEDDGDHFGIGVTLTCLQQAGKLPRQTIHLNTILKTVGGGITSAVLLRKEKTYPMGQCHSKGQSLTRVSYLTSLDLKA